MLFVSLIIILIDLNKTKKEKENPHEKTFSFTPRACDVHGSFRIL